MPQTRLIGALHSSLDKTDRTNYRGGKIPLLRITPPLFNTRGDTMASSRKNDNRNNRPDHKPGHRAEYERNRRRILSTQSICAICGQPVNKGLKFPDPGAPTVDHIIPIDRGGHPSALENLQLAHAACNRAKGNKLYPSEQTIAKKTEQVISADNPAGLPWLIDWTAYKADSGTGKRNTTDLIEQAERLRQQGFIITINGVEHS